MLRMAISVVLDFFLKAYVIECEEHAMDRHSLEDHSEFFEFPYFLPISIVIHYRLLFALLLHLLC